MPGWKTPAFPKGRACPFSASFSFLQVPAWSTAASWVQTAACSGSVFYACCFQTMEGPLSTPARRRKMPNPGAAGVLTGPGLSPDMTPGPPSDCVRGAARHSTAEQWWDAVWKVGSLPSRNMGWRCVGAKENRRGLSSNWPRVSCS